MFPCSITMFIKTLLLINVVRYAHAQDRQLAAEINPGCEECLATKDILVYIKAQGSEDTIHQLWDFTHVVPSVIFVVGSRNSTLNVVWKSLKPVKFEFSDSPPISYSFAAAIDYIIEYNDVKDNGQYETNKTVQQNIWSLENIRWGLNDAILTPNQEARIIIWGRHEKRKGVIQLTLDVLPFKDYAVELPHLIHTANSTLVDIRLVNMTESREFNSSRFALHTVLVSTDDPSGSWTTLMRKSLDDEHTPGVFEIIEVKSSRLLSRGAGGYLQFRPVAYTEPQRGVSSSTNAYISRIDNSSRIKLPYRSIIPSFYKDYFGEYPQAIVAQEAVVSFGLAGDGFYKQHNFTAWSFSIGYGAPPIEGVSNFVLIIISIGLGVPILLTVSGIVYVLLKRCKGRNSPTRLTNDE